MVDPQAPQNPSTQPKEIAPTGSYRTEFVSHPIATSARPILNSQTTNLSPYSNLSEPELLAEIKRLGAKKPPVRTLNGAGLIPEDPPTQTTPGPTLSREGQLAAALK